MVKFCFHVALSMLLSSMVAPLLLAQGGGDYFRLDFRGRSEEVRHLLAGQPDRGARNILFLISPMTCPRCEGLVYDLIGGLAERKVSGAKLCVVTYPRLSGAIGYVRERSFPTRTIIDTGGALFRELGIEQAPPIVSVWDSTGRFLYAHALYGVDGDDPGLWRGILHADGSEPASDASPRGGARSLDVGYDGNTTNWKMPVVESRVGLREDSTCMLGVVGFPAITRNGRFISLTDYLTLTARVFDLRRGTCVRNFIPDYELRKRFSPDIGKSDFLAYEREGIAHSMFFGGYFPDDGTLASIGSLPEFREVTVRSAGGDQGANIAYYNAAVLVQYSIATGIVGRVTRLHPPEKSDLTVTHAIAAPVPARRGTEISVIVGKGYPYVGTSTATAVGSNNPLDPAFYEHAPLFMTFDAATGGPRRELGRLDTLCRRLGVGYALANPRIAFDGDEYFIAQNPVPYIVTGGGKHIPLRAYFNREYLDTVATAARLPSVDEIREMVEMVGARIVDIAARGNDLYVTWHVKRKGMPMKEDYLVCVQQYSVSRGSLVREWGIPFRSEDGTLAALTLDPRTRRAYCVYQTGVSTTVTVNRLD